MKKISVLRFVLIFLLLQSVSISSAEETKSYKCVFMGHSFFAPVARGMEEHAKRAGFSEHQQYVASKGGAGGAPGAFWDDAKYKKKIQSTLDSGKVDLVGMTYHPQGKSDLKHYKLWIDYAISKNKKTVFFIGAPWARDPAMDIEKYAAGCNRARVVIHGLIDSLRKDYPDNQFFCIPYGLASLELKRAFETGKAPDASELIGKKGIYRDRLGHGNAILLKTSQLIWLKSIYKIDLDKYEWNSGFKTKLRPIVNDILKDYAYDDFTPPSKD